MQLQVQNNFIISFPWLSKWDGVTSLNKHKDFHPDKIESKAKESNLTESIWILVNE